MSKPNEPPMGSCIHEDALANTGHPSLNSERIAAFALGIVAFLGGVGLAVYAFVGMPYAPGWLQ